jgi:hypothetical protein
MQPIWSSGSPSTSKRARGAEPPRRLVCKAWSSCRALWKSREEPREVRLVAGYLLKRLLVRQESLAAHPHQILLYPLHGCLGPDDVEPSPFGGGLDQLRLVLLGHRSYGKDTLPNEGCGPTVPLGRVLQAGPVGDLFGQPHVFGFHILVCLPPNQVEDTGCIRTRESLGVGQLGNRLITR